MIGLRICEVCKGGFLSFYGKTAKIEAGKRSGRGCRHSRQNKQYNSAKCGLPHLPDVKVHRHRIAFDTQTDLAAIGRQSNRAREGIRYICRQGGCLSTTRIDRKFTARISWDAVAARTCDFIVANWINSVCLTTLWKMGFTIWTRWKVR